MKPTCSQTEREQRAPYLVGVGREEGECCSQAALSSQQVGILAHLLGQKGAHGVGVHGLRELHGFAQDHHLLYQILKDQEGGNPPTSENNKVKQALD